MQQIIEQYRPAIIELLNQIRSVISNELGQEFANTFITKMIDAAFMEELESIKYLYNMRIINMKMRFVLLRPLDPFGRVEVI